MYIFLSLRFKTLNATLKYMYYTISGFVCLPFVYITVVAVFSFGYRGGCSVSGGESRYVFARF